MRKVLLPTDFSDNASHAIDYAINLFSSKDVKYILVNAFVEPNTSADMLVSINDILQKQAKEDLNKAYQHLINKYPDIKLSLEQRLEYGSLANTLKTTVEHENIDYVVMGTRGASGLKKTFLGSNTSAVIRRVKCPIIIVPEKADHTALNNIALATDYEGLENDRMFHPLIELAKTNNSKVLAVNITREPVLAGRHEQETKGMNLGKQFEGIEQHFYTVDNQNVIDGVRRFVKEHEVDMLVMISKEHPLFDRLFNISLTKEMSMVGDVPLLILYGEK